MPELPEVETVRRTLLPQLVGRSFVGLDVLWAGVLEGAAAQDVDDALRGTALCNISRRGKFLGLTFSGGATLGVHLRMTGRLLVYPPQTEPSAHLRARLRFGAQPAPPDTDPASAQLGLVAAERPCEVHFVDVRKFGRLYWLPEGGLAALPSVAMMGPEPLDEGFTPEVLAAALRQRRAPIKALLLDQRRVAGLGNIYADEALFMARIAPTRAAGTLAQDEISRLQAAIVAVLERSLAHGGTTIRDYVNGLGDIGHMQDFLQAYGKAGTPCPRCGATIERLVLAGRSSFFCPACQT